ADRTWRLRVLFDRLRRRRRIAETQSRRWRRQRRGSLLSRRQGIPESPRRHDLARRLYLCRPPAQRGRPDVPRMEDRQDRVAAQPRARYRLPPPPPPPPENTLLCFFS